MVKQIVFVKPSFGAPLDDWWSKDRAAECRAYSNQ